MIPNTTQIPNNLFNGEMQKMKDTELRLVLIVARKTLGWILNKETGMRKEEDWISHRQLIKLTGRTSRALSTAIDNCIKKGWIEARNEKGEILDTKEKRAGKKIFYRLGRIFLDKMEASEKSKEVEGTSEKSSIEKSSIEKSKAYKRKTITKEITITKDIASQGDASPEGKIINELIEKFKPINPSYEQLFANKTQRVCLERLLKKMGREKLEKIIDFLPTIFGKPYAPVITTPFQLEKKLAELFAYIKREQSKKPMIIEI